MDKTTCDNAIYEEVAEKNFIAAKKNECYGKLKARKSSNTRTIAVISLTLFTTLVLLLVAVAASTGYALFEISKLRTEMASFNSKSMQDSSQQYSILNSKINTVLQQSQNFTVELYENATQQFDESFTQLQASSYQQYSTLASRITQVKNSSNQQYSTLNSTINQVHSSSRATAQQTTTSIAVLKQQSSQNDSALDSRIASIRNQINCRGPGWRRVGYLDMTNSSQSCPSGLALKYYSPELRSCGRATNDSGGCWSTFFSTGTSQYSRVCGRVRGYQFGATDAFANSGISSFYVEGVSLTHGENSSRSHIWTFAAGVTESTSGGFDGSKCPCTTSSAAQPPAFVGNDYFCESGLQGAWIPDTHAISFFPNDPLWDGQNCLGSCCQFNNPPYFIRNLPGPTTDNIELRICVNNPSATGDIPIDQLELYVQ